MPLLTDYQRTYSAPPSPMGEGEDQDYDEYEPEDLNVYSEWETLEPEPTWRENIETSAGTDASEKTL